MKVEPCGGFVQCLAHQGLTVTSVLNIQIPSIHYLFNLLNASLLSCFRDMIV